MKEYEIYRQKAIDWLNGKRNFDEGIKILRESGFRPVVVKVLARQGSNAPSASQRINSLMRDLIKAWKKDDNFKEDTSEELGVVKGVELGSIVENAPNSIFEAFEKKEELPTAIGDVVSKFRNSYMLREKLHKQMAEIGESNSEEAIAQRKALSDAIKVESDIQDKLYPIYAKYLETGELPTEDEAELEEKKEVAKARIDIERSAKKLEDMTKDELSKLRKSLQTKIIRSRNMLFYQQETKAEKENPIPDGDIRRTKYESKIDRLTKRIKEIDYQIALKA